MKDFKHSVLLPSALVWCLVASIGHSALIINFTEGLAPLDQQHGLTSQYQAGYGVSFLPSDGNNWTLFGPNDVWPWVDARGAYVSAGSMLLSFTQPIDYVIFDTWLQSSGITGQGGTVTITVASLTSPSGSVIESANYLVSNTGAQVWTGNQYAEPAQFNFSPSSVFNYVSISRPVSIGIDALTFSPGPGPGPTPIPEPGTWVAGAVFVVGVALSRVVRWRRRLA